MSRWAQRGWIKGARVAAVCISLLWCVLLLRGAWGSLGAVVTQIELRSLTISFFLVASSMLLAFPAFRWMLMVASERSLPWMILARLYFSAQVMRHLPGRFLGVAYQITSTRNHVPSHIWVAVNASSMALNTVAAVIAADFMLMFTGRVEWQWGVAAFGSIIVTCLFGRRVALFFVRQFRIKKEAYLSRLVFGMDAIISNISINSAFVSYGLSWVVYALAWGALGLAIPGASWVSGIELCGYYSLAWLIGFFSFVTPSGLGVRELSFAYFATDYPEPLVAAFAVLGRVLLLAADLGLGVFFVGVRSREESA